MKRITKDDKFARAYAKAIKSLDVAIEELLVQRAHLATEMQACLERKVRAGKAAA